MFSLTKDQREWFVDHRYKEPLLIKNFILESKYDLTPFESEIQERINNNSLLGGFAEDNDSSLSYLKITHSVIGFKKIANNTYCVLVKILSTDGGFITKEYIDYLKICISGFKDSNDEIKKFNRFDLKYERK